MEEIVHFGSFKGPITKETKANGRQIIRTYKNEWDPVKKQSRRISAKQVGTLTSTNQVIFSKGFLADYPEYQDAEVYFFERRLLSAKDYKAQVCIKAASGCRETVLESAINHNMEPDPKLYNQRFAGATGLVMQVSRDLGIDRVLFKVFGEDGVRLLHLLTYATLSDRPWSNFQNWIKKHYIPNAHELSSERIHSLLSKVTRVEFDECWKEIFKRPRDKSEVYGVRYLAIDGTSVSTYSETISIARRGYNKQHEDLDQISVLLTVCQATGEVINAQVNEGSMHDVTAFEGLLNFVNEYELDVKGLCAVTDRGFDSTYVFSKMLSKGMHFICGGVRRQNSMLDQVIQNKYELLTHVSSYRPEIGQYVTTIKDSHFPYLENGHTCTKPVYLHLYRDAGLEFARREQFHKELVYVLDLLRSGKPFKELDSAEKSIAKQFFINVDREKNIWRLNDAKIKKRTQELGIFALWTDLVSDPVMAWKIYRQRNMVELGFNVFKNRLGGDRLYATESTYMGNILLLTLAQSIYMNLYYRLKKNDNNYQESLRDLLDRLDCSLVATYRRQDWSFRTVTKDAEEIFKALGHKVPKRFR